MWNRAELKARGKAAFRANRWRCVLAALLLVFVIGSGTAAGTSGADSGAETGLDADLTELKSAFAALTPEQVGAVLLVIVGAVLVALAVFVVIDILLLNPLEVGCQRFFLVNCDAPAELGELGYGFGHGYKNVVRATLLRDVYLFLWALLFMIPAIVKSYSYRMVPFILAEHPDMDAKDVITLSREMMNGNKWKAFVLDLSFIGWDILACITAGLSGIFYSFPYQCATNAELYRAVRGEG